MLTSPHFRSTGAPIPQTIAVLPPVTVHPLVKGRVCDRQHAGTRVITPRAAQTASVVIDPGMSGILVAKLVLKVERELGERGRGVACNAGEMLPATSERG